MPLTRLTLKLALIPTLIFAAVIALIRAQPYDDSELRAFLTPPDGCPAPCFMGIRPGVTTVDEALAFLESHEWVEGVSLGDEAITWEWNGNQPELFSGRGGYLGTEDSIIQYFDLNTAFKVGEISLVFGIPENFWIGITDNYDLAYAAFYPKEYLWVGSRSNCPYRVSFWDSSVKIILGDLRIGSMYRYDASIVDIIHMSQTYCRK